MSSGFNIPTWDKIRDPVPESFPQVNLVRIPQEYGDSAAGISDIQGYGKWDLPDSKQVPYPVGSGQSLKQLGQTPESKRETSNLPKAPLKACRDGGITVDWNKVNSARVQSHQSGYKATTVVKPWGDFYAPSSVDVKKIRKEEDEKSLVADNKEINVEAVRWKRGYMEVPVRKPEGVEINLQRAPRTLLKAHERQGNEIDAGYYAGLQGQDPKYNNGVLPAEQGL